MLTKALELQERTKKFAVATIRFCSRLPRTDTGRIVSNQLIRSATSVAANYRSACRARSGAEFLSRLSIVVEESDESVFWLEILNEVEMIVGSDHMKLLCEAKELLAIFAASRKTMRRNRNHQMKK